MARRDIESLVKEEREKWQGVVADKDAEIADRDTRIAELEAQLAKHKDD